MLVTILTSTMLSALVLVLAFPKTPTGKWLRRILVEPPARFLRDFTWTNFGRALLIGAAVLLFALASPEMLAVLAAMGMDAAMVELMIAVWFAAVSGSILGVWRTVTRIAAISARLVQAVLTPRNRPRSTRPRKFRSQRKNDDQAEPDWAFA
jgi:hypothetical protein